jgi:long-subunit acyl-CoA synthetase (AMP-forming)
VIVDAANLCVAIPPRAAARARVIGDAAAAMPLAALADDAVTLAAAIRAAGGTRVALFARNGTPWVTADIACQVAATPLLPVPGFFTPAQSAHALARSGVDLVLCDHHAARDQRQLFEALGKRIGPHGESCGLRVLRLAAEGADGAAALPEGTGKITYTSGSTGAPRGVCLGTAQLLRQAHALAAAVGVDGPRHLSLLPLPVLLENVAGVYAALIAGGEVLLPDPARLGLGGSSSVEPRLLLTALDSLQPHTLILIPQLLRLLVLASEQGWRAPRSLRFVAVGGARVGSALIHRARAGGIPVYEGYGLSECASVVSLNNPAADRPGSAGKPLPHLRVAIRDGEVTVAGNPFLGYVDDPASWYRQTVASGDLGHLDEDGFLHLEGRRSNLLVSSFGRNIAPEWVESEIVTGTPVVQCVVFGEARPFLVALVFADARVDDAAIARRIDNANAVLPDYARVRQWLRLPEPLTSGNGLLTANGKPRRAVIGERFGTQIGRLYMASAEAAEA